MEQQVARAALVALAAVGCGDELGLIEWDLQCQADAPCEPVAEWTLLIYAATDVRSRTLTVGFDQDQSEWDLMLGGSAAFVVVVQRDYAPGAGPSVRYRLHRQQRVHPATGAPGVQLLGETESNTPESLRDFLDFGIRAFPARRYWLIITGHGDGWNGLAYDATSGQDARMSVEQLTAALASAQQSIAEVRTQWPRGSDRIDVIEFEACHMGAVETASALRHWADYLIASQNVMPAAGHPYGALAYLAQNRTSSGPRHMVTAMVIDYVRAYSDYFSTRDPNQYRYVGQVVTSVGLALANMEPLVAALHEVRSAVIAERPTGFSCQELLALRRAALVQARDVRTGPVEDVQIGSDQAVRGAAATTVDLVAALEVLAVGGAPADGSWPAAVVGQDVRATARAALELIGRPDLSRVPLQPPSRPEYRQLSGFNRKGPFVVEAHRVDPASQRRVGGLSIALPDGVGLSSLLRPDRKQISPWTVYSQGEFAHRSGWDQLMANCVAQLTAPERAGPP
jgi:hypothetical protein